ncbi:MAG: ABC transporter ATP-binding protein [Deltaproteobacteria bacterium]|nr:ABC transporter ATP-binding protein [Deltaproteobacteria bacterium]
MLLEIDDLTVAFATRHATFSAVRGLSLGVERGEVVGLVGESGCGKSVTALACLRLLPRGVARITGGAIRFDSTDLLALSEGEMRRVRGNRIAMIFQEPMTALNPVFTIGAQVMEPLKIHLGLGRVAARARAAELLAQVGIAEPELRLRDYPHHLSGGQRQRVMIAMALACDPELLIADEPTTALDVTIQAQILALLARLQRQRGLAVLLITHDLGVVAQTADRVAVMYGGELVEHAATEPLFADPRHPYTRGLLASIPRPGLARLTPIPGQVPALDRLPPGCCFHDRCAWAEPRCQSAAPPLQRDGDRFHRCQFVRLGERTTAG